MDEYLHGQDGYRYIEHNRAGQEIVLYRGQERAPRNGYQVHLTIDLNLQNIVENEIDAAMREYSPKKATIILMRPQTGEILAMANRPAFDLNKRSDAKPEQMKNRAICDMMEPGSTFKIVTAAAALNEHKFGLDSYIFCENGVWNYGGTPLHDHAAFGDLERQRYSREIEQHRCCKNRRQRWVTRNFTNTSGGLDSVNAPASSFPAKFLV